MCCDKLNIELMFSVHDGNHRVYTQFRFMQGLYIFILIKKLHN